MGSAEIAPVVVRLVVPAWTSGTCSSPVRETATGSDEMGIFDIMRMAPAQEDRSQAAQGLASECPGSP